MVRRAIIYIIVIVICVISAGSGAEDQPQKRVMNFLAVMDLRCGEEIKKDQCAALTEVLINELVKIKKYTVIDRANRDKILSEAGYQQTGCVDNSCTIEMGRQLGVGKIVVGSITILGETYLVNLQLLNVETAAVETPTTKSCEKCKLDNLITVITNAAHELMGEAPAAAPPSISTTSPRRVTVEGGAVSPSAGGGEAVESFFNALESGDIEGVKRLVAGNPGLVNTKNRDGLYPLHLAALNGNMELAKFLLDNKANVNAKTKCFVAQINWNNATPLFLAVIKGNKDLVEFLLTKGADINVECDGNAQFGQYYYQYSGVTPLHCAAGWGPCNKEMAETLLGHGANVNASAHQIVGQLDLGYFTPFKMAKNKSSLGIGTKADRIACSQVAEILLQHGAR